MIPVRLVLDTNIVVSALLKDGGIQRTVLRLALAKPARWYVSDPILTEYAQVLGRPELKIRRPALRQFLDIVMARGHIVVPSRTLQVTPDPSDNKFIECADAARADYLITGNARHFPKFWKNTKIITSREFLSLVAPHLL